MKRYAKISTIIGMLFIGILVTTNSCIFPPETKSQSTTPNPTLKPTNDVIVSDDDIALIPEIIWQNPGKGQMIPLDGIIEITFDQPMDQKSVEEAWKLISSEKEEIG